MSNTAPVLAGLAIGIGFIMLFSALFPSSSSNFQLRISQEKAVEIAVHDLTTKYIINPPVIKIYAVADMQSQGAIYPAVGTFLEGNYTLPMAHKAVNETFYFVDARTRTLEECQIPYCTFREEGMGL